MGSSDEQPQGITRRQALRKGALLGGALAWATPVVQIVGMKPALAQSVSELCQLTLTVLDEEGEITNICVIAPPELCNCYRECLAAIPAPGPLDRLLCTAQCLVSLGITPGDLELCP